MYLLVLNVEEFFFLPPTSWFSPFIEYVVSLICDELWWNELFMCCMFIIFMLLPPPLINGSYLMLPVWSPSESDELPMLLRPLVDILPS